ncbi:NAD(P)H-binding protein [Microlunatus speluncae]|uniref:NmrA family NAD(P)-binding protein n=1 Tax=Microlunatus speluncae TaxID=2594267 RepID=UPI0012662C3F|nr:NAD(P)H-binding protein [Microlunatus speluncae]
MDPAQVMIIGATGKIGGATLQLLADDRSADPLRLVAASRRPETVPARAGVEVRQLDLDTAELQGLSALVEAMAGIDRLLLITGYGVRMLTQSKVAIDAARIAGVRQVVHIGAHAAADTTVVHLGWHQLIEAYLAASGMAFTNLRPTALMQNLMLLIDVGGVRGTDVLPHYLGSEPTSWVDVADVAAVAARVLRDPVPHAGRSYGLGTESLTMAEIATLLGEVTGRPWRDEARHPDRFLDAVVAAGADPVYMECVRNIFVRTAAGTLPDLNETFDTVERLVGRPAITMRSFLDRHHQQLS